MGVRALVTRSLADQRLAFLAVGGVNTAVGLTVFVVLYALCGDALTYLGALGLAYGLALLSGFWLQRRFVFKVRDQVVADFLRYALVSSGSLALNAVILPALVELADAPVIPAQVASLALVIFLTYFLHTGFTFRRVPEDAGPGQA